MVFVEEDFLHSLGDSEKRCFRRIDKDHRTHRREAGR